MMLSWMTWVMLVGAVVTLSAVVAERAMREAGLSTRWAWMGAIAGSLALPLWHVLGRSISTVPQAAEPGSSWSLLEPLVARAPSVTAVVPPGLSALLDSILVTGWAVGATACTAALLGGLLLLRARAARWPRGRIAGEDVLVSEDFGPALVGVGRPWIVLPRWALRLPAEDLRLACLHEAEHRDARDTWVLLCGALSACLVPWNPALWWQLGRLRAAVEVDCDARVLRRDGASKRAYGTLLLALGSEQGRDPLPVLAFARPRSLLERRLQMIVRDMRAKRPRHAVAAALVSAALLVVACDTRPPTTVDEGEPMASPGTPAGSFEYAPARAGTVAPLTGSRLLAKVNAGEIRLKVDGLELTEVVPADLDPSRIERIEIRKGADDSPDVISIFTKERGGRITPR